MRALRILVLLLMAIGFCAAGLSFGVLAGTYAGLLLWAMAGGSLLLALD